jgi:hypothetical protein
MHTRSPLVFERYTWRSLAIITENDYIGMFRESEFDANFW